MALHSDIWRIINGGNTSTGRTRDGRKVNSMSWKGLSISRHEEINSLIEEYQRLKALEYMGEVKTLSQVRDSARNLGGIMTNYTPTRQDIISRIRDSNLDYRQVSPITGQGGFGSVISPITGENVPGVDPSNYNITIPNIWISPQEAASLFSQKGIFELIVKKKAYAILLNRVKIRNPFLTPDQNKRIKENQERKGFDRAIADGTRDSLVFGGAGLFPVFKKDSPATMSLPIPLMAKLGIVGKNCIDRFVRLDRWNMINIPNWNPTAADYMTPSFYYVPFLGSEVSGQRVARIITAPQAGYWGNIMTLGWGISDYAGYAQAGFNYLSIMEAVPTMIRQMSTLIRTMNVEGSLATEGNIALEEMMRDDAVRIRQTSVFNPIGLDVIGDIKAIQRDFKEVPELVRLIRQDFSAKANIPEELIWSSEKGAFAGGDTTDSAYEKQSEGVRFVHMDVADQVKNMAQLLIIDTLGLDREVLKALPYTYVEFDEPRISNSKDRADITGKVMKGIFDATAAGMKTSTASKLSEILAGDEFEIPDTIIREIESAEAQKEELDKEKHEMEMRQMEAQVKQAENPSTGLGKPGAGIGKPKKPASSDEEKKGHSYDDPLEQAKHTKVGNKGRQGLAKAENKKVIKSSDE